MTDKTNEMFEGIEKKLDSIESDLLDGKYTYYLVCFFLSDDGEMGHLYRGYSNPSFTVISSITHVYRLLARHEVAHDDIVDTFLETLRYLRKGEDEPASLETLEAIDKKLLCDFM
jgi:hypothetical protein